jgi:hypothetical protein
MSSGYDSILTINLSSARKNSCTGTSIGELKYTYTELITIKSILTHWDSKYYIRIQFGDVYPTNFHNFFVSSTMAPMLLLIGDLL